MRKDARGRGPRNSTGALLKEENHNFAERCIDIAILGGFFIRLNQLNSSRHGKGKILLDVSESSSLLKINYSCGSIKLKMEEYLGF